MDMNKMDRIQIDDLQAAARGLRRCASSAAPGLREAIDAGMPDIDKAVGQLQPRRLLPAAP